MKLSDIVSLSLRAFKVKPMRTFLTILGVSVAIGTVLFLVSLGYGLQNVILHKITTADALLSMEVVPGPSGSAELDQKYINKIASIPEVAEVSPAINLSAQFTMDELIGDGTVYAVPVSFFRLGGITTQYGKVFSDNDAHNIVISSATVKLFNMNAKQIIGKRIKLTLFLPITDGNSSEDVKTLSRSDDYKIIGIIEDDNNSFAFIPQNTISDLRINRYAQLKVKVKSNEFMGKVRNEIINEGFTVSSLSDTIDQANKIFHIVQIILALFGFVALLVSAIGMINTMTITLLERINEIGIMRAVGASASDISKLFLIESLLMGFLGGVGGVLMGYTAGEIVNFIVNILAHNFGGQAIKLFYRPPWFIAVIIVSSSVIGLLTGIYPSRRASKINPLEALRYK